MQLLSTLIYKRQNLSFKRLLFIIHIYYNHVFLLRIHQRLLIYTTVVLFHQAIDEPNFSEAYSNMCRTMSQRQVTKDEGGKTLEFRKLLLTRCQREFEKDHQNEAAIQKLVEEINAFDDKTPKVSKALFLMLSIGFVFCEGSV